MNIGARKNLFQDESGQPSGSSSIDINSIVSNNLVNHPAVQRTLQPPATSPIGKEDLQAMLNEQISRVLALLETFVQPAANETAATASQLRDAQTALTQVVDSNGEHLEALIQSLNQAIAAQFQSLGDRLVQPPPPVPVETMPETASSDSEYSTRYWGQIAASSAEGSLQWEIATCLDAISAPQVRQGWFLISSVFAVFCMVFMAVMPPVIGNVRGAIQEQINPTLQEAEGQHE